MKKYLIDFFREFDYEDKDAIFLLDAYEKIVSYPESEKIWSEAIIAYNSDVMLDYSKEILENAVKAGNIAGVHSFTAELLIFICLSKRLKEMYAERGIDMQIYRDSMLDLKWKLNECKAVWGICGSFVAGWFPGFFRLERFALGRLQFEIVTIPRDYCKNGIVLKKGESKVINTHIPRTGTPIDKKSCDEAYAKAREFYKKVLGENAPFVCDSWLLFPENKNILPTGTNTCRFMSEYDIIEWSYNNGEDLWRLFDTDEKDPDKLPADTTFRKCYVEYLKNGGRVGRGFGVKI